MSFGGYTDRTGASKKHVEDTKRLFAGLLSKPLDERQLARPSFKFIQDLVKSLISETKILRDVFNPTDFETNNGPSKTKKRPTNSSDAKQAKLAFVQKLIDFAANNKQPVIGCVASKIVAGLEPNKTNELLQSLARVGQAKLNATARDSAQDRPRTFTRQQSESGGKSRAGSSSGAQVAARSAPEPGKFQRSASISQQQVQVRKDSRASNSGSATKRDLPSQVPRGTLVSKKQPDLQAPQVPQTVKFNAKPATLSQEKLTARNINREQIKVASESDIAGKGINHVRAHLKSLRTTMAEIVKQEATLRDALLISITNSQQPSIKL